MATSAVFVGINKHRDPAIPELGGARHDATALWALFTDTIEGLSARLLVDERATHADVSAAILGALDAAREDDVVIVGFAGHGSPDGSLVLFDTDAADLAGTALPMAALADAFKRTRARAVFCVLDCCFRRGSKTGYSWSRVDVAGSGDGTLAFSGAVRDGSRCWRSSEAARE